MKRNVVFGLFSCKGEGPKLVAVQARALNVGHLGVNLGLDLFGYAVLANSVCTLVFVVEYLV